MKDPRKFGNFFLVYHIDVAGKYANKPRPNWGMSIFVYLVIAFFIGITVISAINSDKQPALTPEQWQDRWEHDPRW